MKNYLISLFLMTAVAAILMCSCQKKSHSGQLEENQPEIQVDTAGKHIVSITEIDTEDFIYQEDGKLMKVLNSYAEDYVTDYAWGRDSVAVYFHQDGRRWNMTFKDGLVRRYDSNFGNNFTFQYDEKGRLSRIEGISYDGPMVEEYAWEGDRLVSLFVTQNASGEYPISYEYTFRYLEKPCSGTASPLRFLICEFSTDYLMNIHPELFGMKTSWVPEKIYDHRQLYSTLDHEIDEEGYLVCTRARKSSACSDVVSYFKWE